jgi:hypothetical protein
MTDAEILNGIGFGRGDMAYWDTVYRTNEATCQNAGRALGFEEAPPVALELVGISDARQSDICYELTKQPFIRPYGDPVWQSLWPPFHFNCRTTVRAIYDPKELDEYGGADNAYKLGYKAKPEKGFGGYPLDKESYWRLTPEMGDRARHYGIDGEIAKAAINLGMKNYALELVKDYSTAYVPASGHGYVKVSEIAKPKGKEMELAKLAADEGHEIFFLPESTVEKIKNPDIIIDGQVGDIKHVSTPTDGAINGAVRGAYDQYVSIALMQVTDKLPWETIEKEVRSRMGSRIKTALIHWRGAFRTIKK